MGIIRMSYSRKNKKKGGGCYKNFYPSKDYICPDQNTYSRHNTLSVKDSLAAAMSGGDCQSFKDTSQESHTAWKTRYGDASGGGYYLQYNHIAPGKSSRSKYTKNCSPVGGYKKNGLIRRSFNKSGKSIKKAGCGSCGVSLMTSQNGGAVTALNTVSKLIAPLGASELATLVVLLFLNHWTKKSKKYQKGGNFVQLVDVILPMGKNNLLVLASLLLLNYLSKKKSSKKQKGGSDVLPFIDKLLAPLGVNAFGASWLLVILNEAFKNKGKKKQRGGNNGNDENNVGGNSEHNHDEHNLGGNSGNQNGKHVVDGNSGNSGNQNGVHEVDGNSGNQNVEHVEHSQTNANTIQNFINFLNKQLKNKNGNSKNNNNTNHGNNHGNNHGKELTVAVDNLL